MIVRKNINERGSNTVSFVNSIINQLCECEIMFYIHQCQVMSNGIMIYSLILNSD